MQAQPTIYHYQNSKIDLIIAELHTSLSLNYIPQLLMKYMAQSIYLITEVYISLSPKYRASLSPNYIPHYSSTYLIITSIINMIKSPRCFYVFVPVRTPPPPATDSCSCNNFSITFWIFFHFWHDYWPWPVDYLIRFWWIFITTLTFNFQGQIWNLLYLCQKWSDCHKTKNKLISWNLGLKCDHWLWPWPWPWPWIFKVKYRICYISAKNDLIATKRKANIDWTQGLKSDHQLWPWSWPWPWIFKVKYGICYISAKSGLIAMKQKANISIELLDSNVTNGFDLDHDNDLWILKVKCDLDLWPHTWPWTWIFMVKFWNICISEWEDRLTLHKGGGSRSFKTILWPRSGVWIYQKMTRVTSVVGVSSTHLVMQYPFNDDSNKYWI